VLPQNEPTPFYSIKLAIYRRMRRRLLLNIETAILLSSKFLQFTGGCRVDCYDCKRK
jgi:hypothetical protein